MFERFTEKAIKVIMLVQQEAYHLSHNFVGTEHILLGMIAEGTGVGAILKTMGGNLRDARIELEKIIGRNSGFIAREISFTPRARRVLELSQKEAHQLWHNYIDTEHLLLDLLREGEGNAARVLQNWGVDYKIFLELTFNELKDVHSGAVIGEPMFVTTDFKQYHDYFARLNSDGYTDFDAYLPFAVSNYFDNGSGSC